MSTAAIKDPVAGVPGQTFRFWGQLEAMYRWFRRALFLGAILAILFLSLEAIRMYQTLAAIHPMVGVVALVAVGIAVALVVAPAWRFLRMPKVVEPPPLPPGGKMTRDALIAEIHYLDKYLANCARNTAFGTQWGSIQTGKRELTVLLERTRIAADGPVDSLRDQLADWSKQRMAPILSEVDAKVDRLIYQEALSVGLATAASPNGVLDAFVMLWRSIRLVSEIGVLYYGRPGPRGTIAICRDVSMAVAVAGYLQNVTDSLGNVLAGTLGKVGGMVAGPAVDGVTNAIVLIRIGYLAKERCRSYRRWDAATRKNALLSAMSATRNVAFGLTTEILRQVGWGVTALAGGLASKLNEAGSSAMDAVENAAQNAGRVASDVVDAATRAADAAMGTARNVYGKFGEIFRGTHPNDSIDPHAAK